MHCRFLLATLAPIGRSSEAAMVCPGSGGWVVAQVWWWMRGATPEEAVWEMYADGGVGGWSDGVAGRWRRRCDAATEARGEARARGWLRLCGAAMKAEVGAAMRRRRKGRLGIWRGSGRGWWRKRGIWGAAFG